MKGSKKTVSAPKSGGKQSPAPKNLVLSVAKRATKPEARILRGVKVVVRYKSDKCSQ